MDISSQEERRTLEQRETAGLQTSDLTYQHLTQVCNIYLFIWLCRVFIVAHRIYLTSWGIFPWSIQFSSVTQSCPTLCNPMDCSTPGLPVHHQLPELTQTHVLWVGDAIQPSHPLLSLLLPSSIFPSIRVFSNESALRIRWPKYWSFSFSISPSNEYSGLISFRMDWLDLLAVQGTLGSFLQHHRSKASTLFSTSFLHSPTFTSIYDHWKNHSLD